MEKPILSTVFCISNNYKRYIASVHGTIDSDKTNSVTRMIISYMSNTNDVVYQKTLENHFGFSRSTASNIITLMEKEDLVVREKVDGDQRLKKLVLTDKAKEIYSDIKEDMLKYESILTKNLSIEEKKQLYTLLNKLRDAMGKE